MEGIPSRHASPELADDGLYGIGGSGTGTRLLHERFQPFRTLVEIEDGCVRGCKCAVKQRARVCIGATHHAGVFTNCPLGAPNHNVFPGRRWSFGGSFRIYNLDHMDLLVRAAEERREPDGMCWLRARATGGS